MKQYPEANQLINAVRTHLDTNVMPLLQGHDAFQLRIALHTLSILERELDTENGSGNSSKNKSENNSENNIKEQLEKMRFSLTQEKDEPLAEAALIQKIKAGELCAENPELMDYLIRHTQQQLRINSPDYQHELQHYSVLSGHHSGHSA